MGKRGPKRRPAGDRFWPFVNKNGPIPEHRPDLGPCWLWAGADNGRGYGRFGSGGKYGPMVYAHRFAYELLVGPIPEGLHLDHLCRVTMCVRPSHLEPVTNRENIVRGLALQPPRVIVLYCPRGHFKDGIAKSGKRFCRECSCRWARESKRRRKHEDAPAR